MGLARWLTTMTCLTAAGIALERPQQVADVVNRYIAPVHAEEQVTDKLTRPAPANDVGHDAATDNQQVLPHFIPGGHALTLSDDAAGEGDEAPPNGPQQPSAAATGAILPPAAQPQAGVQPVPPVVIEQAAAPAADKPAAEAKRQVITIEPDPTLQQNAPNKAPEKVAKKPAPVVAAKTLFGAAKAPSPLAARAIGTYARGCLAGAVALPVDGPAWQAMRLSRNRNWGHPELVKVVERLALDSKEKDGWPGLLVGDLSQPRGGPMLTGHASHQLGLDADVWLTPMPDRRLTRREREDISATSMLDSTDIAVDPKVFTPGHVQLIKRAASYPQVERVLVHPAIKKALCEAAGADRAWLGKVRPIQGHYYHFHIRIGCPAGSSATCKPQVAVTGDDGCGKEVDEWIARVTPYKGPPRPKPPRPPGWKPPPPPPPITMASLPEACTAVLESGPDGIAVPHEPKPDLKAIVNAPAALKPHLRKAHTAKN